MINIAIVDDESCECEKLAELIRNFFAERKAEDEKEFNITFFPDGMSFVTGYNPIYDVIFLDVEMNLLSGFDTARQLRKLDEKSVIIFETKMAQYAAKGYEVDALGYLVKPVNYYDLNMFMVKALKRIDEIKGKRITVSSGANRYIFTSDEIYYIESVAHDIYFHTRRGTIKTRGTMKVLNDKLNDGDFVFCNQSYFVNLKYVSEVEKATVTVRSERLQISRLKRKTFMDALRLYGKK